MKKTRDTCRFSARLMSSSQAPWDRRTVGPWDCGTVGPSVAQRVFFFQRKMGL